MKIKAVNGFKDILPEEIPLWRFIEEKARDIFRRFCFEEIRLPILEETRLFARSIGQSTDIVEKEMYSFTDKGQTLRPEATASLLRAFIEHGMHVRKPAHRLFTIGPMFRHERPQKGRLRQFHQIDAEIIGGDEPEVDAELMAMGQMLLAELGLEASLEVNSLGCPQCRPQFRAELIGYFQQYTEQLCGDCRRRLATNPLRVLDCKNPGCRELVTDAPSILDALCADCDEHFSRVTGLLDALGVVYSRNHLMVRGLDYYTRTTFEFITRNLGAQAAVGAGGRYDGLIRELGGPDLSGIGFAMGIERLVLLLQQQQEDTGREMEKIDLFVAALGDRAISHGFSLVHRLRKAGIAAAMDYSRRSLKAQMKQAGRLGARYTLIVGDQELDNREAILRDMTTQDQTSFSLAGDIDQESVQLAALLTTN
ncbi:MAG: histidine--tRNA ligase [Desulfobulbaceae bacterium]